MPKSQRYYTEPPDGGKLARMLHTEVGNFSKGGGVKETSLSQTLPSGLDYIAGSASEPPADVIRAGDQTTLRWTWDQQPQASEPHTVTYGVQPLKEGEWPVSGLVEIKDRRNLTTTLAMAPVTVTVSGLCLPDTPTPTPTVTSTDTPPPPPTTTPMPTATSTPESLYLPLLLREKCRSVYQRADVALVIDTSSSMAGPKLAAAKDAALTFVDAMDFTPARDQVAIVRFDASADVVQELTSDGALVVAAISALQSRQGTHIDRGLRSALAELQSARRIDANLPVLVLLTDGRHTGDPGAELVAAQEVRDAGIHLYAIGVGADVDATTLIAMAGDEQHYYFAPDAGHLQHIYAEVAQDIQCPAAEVWPYR